MANYSNSTLVDAIGIVQERTNAKEFRRPAYGAHEVFLKDREFSLPNLAQDRLSENRTTTAKYLTRYQPTVGSARSCSPTATYGDSGTVDLSWTTYSTTVKISDKMHRNNYFSPEKALAAQLEGAMRELHDDIEAAQIAYLELYKTGVNAGSAWLGTFADDIFKVANANENNYFEYISTVMKENKYAGNYMAVQNVAAQALINYQMAQGAGNSTNLGYNYGDIDMFASHAVTSGSDYKVKSYVVEPWTVAMLDWIPGLNRSGKVSGQEEWTTMEDLFGFPITWSVFKTEGCADTTATGGSTQDLVTTWEISADIALARAPISATDEEAIFKFGLLSS